ncbi:MAG: GIY-YIG nuclease family protein [Phycisphaerae bacterium]|nr:GIY-YIG nuclease family protein [Phycisphaerae bacterium]
MWNVYMLRCRGGVIYTGFTDDVERRFKEHIQGKGGRCTRCHRPEEILYKESFAKKSDAKKREI